MADPWLSTLTSGVPATKNNPAQDCKIPPPGKYKQPRFHETESSISLESTSWYRLLRPHDATPNSLVPGCCGMRFKRRGYIVIATTIGLIMMVFVWFSIITAQISLLSKPPPPWNGVSRIAANWTRPGDERRFSPWPTDFSRDIRAISCHSHNDYERPVPLFDAIAAGCTGVEADLWRQQDRNASELLVGHKRKSLSSDRTLRSLYIDPLIRILDYQNQGSTSSAVAGVFDTNPNATLVLLLDFKSYDPDMWSLVEAQLQPLREKQYLTYWNTTSQSRVQRPLTIVASGEAQIDPIVHSTHHDIFFDAPLNDLKPGGIYTQANSYYASVSLSKAVGRVLFGMSAAQLSKVDAQIRTAKDLGLVSRYWNTPGWPVSARNGIWTQLLDKGVGMLNVDSLDTAAGGIGGFAVLRVLPCVEEILFDA